MSLDSATHLFFLSSIVVHSQIIFQPLLPAFPKSFKCECDSKYFRKPNQSLHWNWQSYIFSTRLNHQCSCGTDFVGLSKKNIIWSAFSKISRKCLASQICSKFACFFWRNDVLARFPCFSFVAWVLRKKCFLVLFVFFICLDVFFREKMSFDFVLFYKFYILIEHFHLFAIFVCFAKINKMCWFPLYFCFGCFFP